MTNLTRFLAIASFMFLSIQSYSSEEVHPGDDHRGTYSIEGEVVYGPMLQCEFWNDSDRPIRVINYTYKIWFRNPWGRLELATRLFQCRYNCRLGVDAYNIFSGPVNDGPTVSATCSALVR
ncbi:hypothetical protein A9Q84_02040 [Halobacteriovorax marinus]|uniref:Uncharacterized protein n=1 Tax=Halobacteriovorax marinus TaxID=97084 RepID=A0A1Y5FCA0_9BACT|nr:hypothetical protein A9Q84_02040 [Halobacteriovorax marinus]